MNMFAELTRPIQSRPGDFPVLRPRKKYPAVANPWGLSGMQCATLSLVAAGCSYVEAGQAMGVSSASVEARIRDARKLMGAKTTAQAAVMFDRMVRPQ